MVTWGRSSCWWIENTEGLSSFTSCWKAWHICSRLSYRGRQAYLRSEKDKIATYLVIMQAQQMIMQSFEKCQCFFFWLLILYFFVLATQFIVVDKQPPQVIKPSPSFPPLYAICWERRWPLGNLSCWGLRLLLRLKRETLINKVPYPSKHAVFYAHTSIY